MLLCCMMVFTCLSFTGCGSTANDTDTLVYGSKDYTSINPALYEHGEINALLFAGLTAHDKNNKVVPGMAKSWSWNESTKTYTFNLKKGLTFHDGKALTSADVKFTLEAILNKDNNSEIVSNYTDIEKITCPDKLTVNIKLKQANVAFPEYMTIGILPKHLLEGKDMTNADFNTNPVGSGPYKLVKWDKGESITMEAFKGYYGGTPKIKNVVFKIIDDSDARALALKKGEIDMAQITPKDAKTLSDNKDFNIYDMKTADYRAICYNFNNKFFKKHSELPNILSYAINRKAIVKSVLLGEGQVAYSPIQKNKYNYSGMKKFTYNKKKCVSLLKADGWKKNKDGYFEKNGEELKFTIWAMADDQVRIDMAKMCAKELQDVGVNAIAKSKESLDWEHQTAAIIGWGSPFDADDHTYKVFTTGAGDNYTYYSNSAVDKTLTAARHTENSSARKALYKQFQIELTQNMPYSFICYVDADYAIRTNISGITKSTILGHHGVGVFYNIADWTKGSN